MAKTTNFKANFSKILGDKYKMSEDGIRGYWDNKKEEEEYDRKRMIAACVGAGEIVGSIGFAVWDSFNGADCGAKFVFALTAGVLTTAIALQKTNPYTKAEYAEIDEEYKTSKARAKKKSREIGRK